MRRIILLFLCLLCICCRQLPAMSTPPVDARTAAERVESMSVAILDEDDGTAECGGTWVGEREILTAYHCVKEVGQPKAVGLLNDILKQLGGLEFMVSQEWDPRGWTAHYRVKLSEEKLEAMVLHVDVEDDLALLWTPALPPIHDYARVAPGTIRVGDPVDIMGSTAGLPFTYSRGYVAAIRSAEETMGRFKTLQISGPVYFGNSGGGAFDAHGDLVGVADFMRLHSINGTIQVVPDLSFFIHRDVIVAFLKGASI